MSFTHFRIETDADGVALVTWDSPGRSMNVLDNEAVEEIGKFGDQIAADPNIKGAVNTSGKGAFSGGGARAMVGGRGAQFGKIPREKGEEAAMRVFFDNSRQISL